MDLDDALAGRLSPVPGAVKIDFDWDVRDANGYTVHGGWLLRMIVFTTTVILYGSATVQDQAGTTSVRSSQCGHTSSRSCNLSLGAALRLLAVRLISRAFLVKPDVAGFSRPMHTFPAAVLTRLCLPRRRQRLACLHLSSSISYTNDDGLRRQQDNDCRARANLDSRCSTC